MESRGKYFYRTASHPTGIVESADVVVIKVNNQWGLNGHDNGIGRLSTNTDALKGVKSVKAIFDVRVASPKAAVIQLNLIHQTYQQLVAENKKPGFVVSFMGPAVKLISKSRQGFGAEEQKSLDEIAVTISRMAKDGFRVEICMFAAGLFGVDPASILPEIKKVENGWISLAFFF